MHEDEKKFHQLLSGYISTYRMPNLCLEGGISEKEVEEGRHLRIIIIDHSYKVQIEPDQCSVPI